VASGHEVAEAQLGLLGRVSDHSQEAALPQQAEGRALPSRSARGLEDAPAPGGDVVFAGEGLHRVFDGLEVKLRGAQGQARSTTLHGLELGGIHIDRNDVCAACGRELNTEAPDAADADEDCQVTGFQLAAQDGLVGS